MWPMLLDMTRDDCRRTLRRLELEAYSSMISVFRAQGALADDRKKLLEDLRGALNISNDRHTAEARRVSNDELLSTIAEQLSGPNTGLGWVCEGRRKIPILPRGIPQTMYTEIADKAANIAARENERMAQILASEEQKSVPVSPKSPMEHADDMEVDESAAATGEEGKTDIKNTSQISYPPVVMWDQSLKVAADEGPPRKRSRPDLSATSSTPPTPPANRANHQRYLNISQIYSSYSKTTPAKQSNQPGGKNYAQGGKMQGKTNYGHVPKSVWKHRSLHGKHGNAGKHSGQVAIPHHQVRSGIKSPTDPHIAGSQALNMQNPVDANTLKSQTSGFQANFAQSIAKSINLDESINDVKQPGGTTHVLESPTMQLLTQPPVPQETSVALPSPDETCNIPNIINTNTPIGSPALSKGPQTVSGKACHLIIKKKGDSLGENNPSSQKIHVTNMQIISKPSDMGGIKVLQNRQVVVAPSQNTPQKMINSSGKLITTKFVQQIPQKSQSQLNANIIPKSSAPNTVMEKVIIVSKSMSSTAPPSILQRSLSNTTSKNIIISSHSPITHINKDGDLSNQINKSVDSDGSISKVIPINNSEMKLPTKTFVLTPKSCQKMVILPAKAGSKGSLIGQSVPQLQVKGIPGRQTTMKLVPAGNQLLNSQNKSSNLTIVSKANSNMLATKIISKDSLTHINIPTSENSPIKIHQTSHVQIAPKPKGQAIIRPAATNKSNLVVVQKGNSISKGAITFTKNGNDISKIMMSNKISPITPQPTSMVTESEVNCAVDINKNTGNVIVLQLSSEQLEQASNLTEFLEGDQTAQTLTTNQHLSMKPEHPIITEDTPVLFHTQIGDQVCNTDSMESTPDTLMNVVNIENAIEPNKTFSDQQSLQKLDLSDSKKSQLETTASSIVTDWDIEMENTSDKEKSSDMNKLALELEMSSDSETDGYLDSSQDESKKDKHELKENESIQRHTDEHNAIFQQHSSIIQTSRTLLSQLQDEGSSSNDSSFVLTKNLGKKFIQSDTSAQSAKQSSPKDDVAQKAKEECNRLLGGSLPEPKSQSRASRMDIFSTAIASADINLDSFEYLEDGMMSGDDMFHLPSGEQVKGESVGPVGATLKDKSQPSLEQQLHQLLGDDNIDDAERLGVGVGVLESCPRSGAME